MTDSQTPLAQLDITLEHATVVNFALQHIDVPLVRRIVIVNRGERDVGPLSLHIAIEPPVAPPLRHDILESLRPGETLAIDDRVLVMRLSAERLARQLSTDHGTLTVTVATPDATRTETRPVAIHAFNAWLRDVHPESLACFVEPGHPALLPLLQAAQEELGRTTGDSALDGYQSGSERARLIARALWRALQSAGVGYVEAPARAAGDGETVRPPDRTLIDHIGTSLDLSVLYAALLEQAGLHPLLVVARDRVTPGCFLVERERLSAATSDDLTEVTKRLADGGRGSLLLVDAAACTKAGTSFEAAESAAAAGLERARFELAIDVSQARRDGVRPLPLVRDRRDEPLAAVEAPLAPGLAPTAPASAPEAARMADVRPVVAEATPLERRLESWKSQLLDLSLRNPLLAFKWEGKRCLPIAGHDIARLEDGLASREPFALAPHEDGQRSRVQLERRTGARAADPRLATLLAEGRIEVDLGHAELEKRLTELYRQSRSVTEESGSTALWLALGFVEWVDDKALPAEQKPLYAPIILLPVEIVRAAARDPFRLRLAEDEARINSTLLAKLASQFRADVAGYDDLPEDDAGLDVPLILERFRQLVKPIPKCQVVDRAAVAMFSFAKYLMWLDLEARTDALLANPVVRHLLGGADRAFPLATPFVARAELDRRRPPADDLSVVEADSSQLVAVQAAVDGDTFVLEGPPGTGKSQTITNLVAEAMGRGKSVLFVAEKRAAVDVVQRRLEAVGLGRFVLDLHAPDQTKAEIVAALAANLDLKGDGDAGALAATGAALQKVRDQLAAVWRELHAPGAAGMSAWQAVSRLGDLGAAPILSHSFAGSGDGQGAFDSERAARVREAVHALGHASRSVAPMASHPFAGAAIHSWDARAQTDVGAALEAARGRVEETRRLGSEVADLLGLELAPETAEALRLLTALAAELGRAPRRTATFVGDRRHESELQPVIETVALSEQRRRRWSELEPRWKPELLALDVEPLAAKLARWQGAFFLIAFFALFFTRRRLAPVARGKLGDRKALARDLGAAVALREDDRRLAERQRQVPEVFGEGTPEEITARVASARTLLRTRRELAVFAGAIDLGALLGKVEPSLIAPRAAALASAQSRMDEALADVARRLTLDAAVIALPLGELSTRLASMSAELRTLRDWSAWQRARADAMALDLGTFVAALEDGRLTADALEPALERSLATWRVEQRLSESPVLAAFRGADHEDLAARFKQLDAERQAAARAEIALRLAAALPDGTVDGGEVGALRAESKKKRRHLALRRLFAKIRTILPRLKPCVLASPMSVAAYLDPTLDLFDLVVFDEASQIPPWDAIGALGRGKSAVVVGDSKQMPPTDFFGGGDEDDVAAEDDIEELESILDECDRAGLAKLSLSWHYRSRHPSLIHFSNHRYYGGSLIAFPAADADVATLGVKWRRVDGRYERGVRHNVIEAEALVGEVLARLRDPVLSRKSIGIVTFAQPQQQLIIDMLEAARRAEPALERFFDGAAREPVFVKNLENVQGDERDVMFFGVGFGPDAQGRVSMNFGALNRRGGERRLNVAVTRARELLVVFASMDASAIDVERTGAVGVQHLKEFLELAERGGKVREAEELAARGKDQAGFLAGLEARLRAEGYQVDRDLAAQGPRIDLAVRDPHKPDRYLLGVVTDGVAWARFPALRDREKLGPSVLANLGWNIQRVFALDVWQDPEREIERVLTRLRSLATAPPAAATPRAAPPEPAPAPVLSQSGPREPSWLDGAAAWEPCDIPAIAAASALDLPGSYDTVASRLAAVIEAEGPLHRDEALRRAFASWQVTRVGPKMARLAEQALAQKPDAGRPRLFGDFYWPSRLDPGDFVTFRTGSAERRREVEHLPVEEVTNAFAALLRRGVGLTRAEAVAQVGAAFGFDRRGKKIDELLHRGLDRLVELGRAHEVDGRLALVA